MRGAFDAEMGARIQARIRAEAERLRQADRRLMRTHSAANANDTGRYDQALQEVATDGTALNGSTGTSSERSRDQRMADALDCILTHATPDTTLSDTVAGGPVAGSESSANSVAASAAEDRWLTGDAAIGAAASRDPATPNAASGDPAIRATSLGDARSTAHKCPSTQIIVRAEFADLLSEHGGMGEIAGTGPVPASVIDRLCCNADISIVLFGKQLIPLYEATAARAPTAAQRSALIARDGACIGCGATPDECEAHHIIPWIRGGPTQIDNLVLVCWRCHDRIHDHNWQVVISDGRYRLVPPDAMSPPSPARSKKPTQCPKPAFSQEAALSHDAALARDAALFS